MLPPVHSAIVHWREQTNREGRTMRAPLLLSVVVGFLVVLPFNY